MSRLTASDIKSISDDLLAYDLCLFDKTGCSLRQIACKAAGTTEDDFLRAVKSVRLGVIPVTAGEGALQGFCSTVAAIVNHIGCSAFVSEKTDVAGFIETAGCKANIIMMADDDRFMACHLKSRQFFDNAAATGKGFAMGLSLMAGNIESQEVVVIGCGPVGQSAAKTLASLGAIVSIVDLDPSRCESFLRPRDQAGYSLIRSTTNLNRALGQQKLIVDASPGVDLIHADIIGPRTYLSAPGMPLGLDKAAVTKLGHRLLHDPLQIGVATMTVEATMANATFES